jgi:hypothetical protein
MIHTKRRTSCAPPMYPRSRGGSPGTHLGIHYARSNFGGGLKNVCNLLQVDTQICQVGDKTGVLQFCCRVLGPLQKVCRANASLLQGARAGGRAQASERMVMCFVASYALLVRGVDDLDREVGRGQASARIVQFSPHTWGRYHFRMSGAAFSLHDQHQGRGGRVGHSVKTFTTHGRTHSVTDYYPHTPLSVSCCSQVSGDPTRSWYAVFAVWGWFIKNSGKK